MIRVGIAIDGVIRDFVDRFGALYRKKYIYNPNIVGMNDDFTVKLDGEDEVEQREKKIEELTGKWINEPVNSDDLLNHYHFEAEEKTTEDDDRKEVVEHFSPKDMLNKFIEENPFQLFARASEISGSMKFANILQSMGGEEFEISLIGNLKGGQIPATLFFLAESGSRIKNLHFVSDDYEKWDKCDVLIDYHTPTLEDKPDNKVSIKFKNLTNEFTDADYEIDSLKELIDGDLSIKNILSTFTQTENN